MDSGVHQDHRIAGYLRELCRVEGVLERLVGVYFRGRLNEDVLRWQRFWLRVSSARRTNLGGADSS